MEIINDFISEATNRSLSFQIFTGTVMDSQTQSNTVVSGGGGTITDYSTTPGLSAVSGHINPVKSEVRNQQTFWIKQTHGPEIAVQLNKPIPLRCDQTLTLIKATANSGTSYWVRAINHNSHERHTLTSSWSLSGHTNLANKPKFLGLQMFGIFLASGFITLITAPSYYGKDSHILTGLALSVAISYAYKFYRFWRANSEHDLVSKKLESHIEAIVSGIEI